MEIKIQSEGLAELGRQLGAMPEAIEKATRRAIVRVSNWANVQAIRRVAGVVSIKPRVIRGRVKVSIRTDSGLVFIGLDEVSAGRLSPRQSKAGVTAAGRSFPGAFIWRTGKPKVMKRRGKDHFPIDKQSVEISSAAFPALDALSKEVAEKLKSQFLHEIGWILQRQN